MNFRKIKSFFTKKFGEKKGAIISEIVISIIISIWFIIFMAPLMVVKVDTINKKITWRWNFLLYTGIIVFFVSIIWRKALEYKDRKSKLENSPDLKIEKPKLADKFSNFQETKYFYITLAVLAVVSIVIPHLSTMYQTTVLSQALIYIMLGLGLNIVVGLGGLLHLGYVAFYAFGAYSYALLNLHFGLPFWYALPIGALISTIFGVLMAVPILRLRGDYLAIVTLAFGEMVRLFLENGGDFTKGPSGISHISRPEFFGIHLKLQGKTILMYYIILAMVALTILVVYRLKNSRIGRAWQALREDEIATKAMGINVALTKLTSVALGATWAGFGGVLFAGKTTVINPQSFTLMDSVIVLCFVVLGGKGSIVGVSFAALILYILPESFRAFAQYRMLIYGMALVMMMIFRPEGIIRNSKKHYKLVKKGS